MSSNLKNLIEDLSGVLKKHNASIYASADLGLIIIAPDSKNKSVSKLYVNARYIDSDYLNKLSNQSCQNTIDLFIL